MSKQEKRPGIPDAVAREIRKRCGFGCVICGCPIYDYEHMLEWANVKRHVAAEITLLCPEHHRAKTGKRLPAYIVAEADKNPFNLRYGASKPDLLYFDGPESTVLIAGSKFTINCDSDNNVFIPLRIHGVPIIEIKLVDNHFLFNITLFNENNEIIFLVKDNILQFSSYIWDIEYIANRLIVRDKSRSVLLDIKFLVPDVVQILRGNFQFGGSKVIVKPDRFLFKDITIIAPESRGSNCLLDIIPE